LKLSDVLIPSTSSNASDETAATNGAAKEDDEKESFSACLLVLDENHRLPEWLAYHYLTLPLRYLVVAVDPHSKTSPTPIFDRFRKYTNMTIVEWTDKNFTRLDLIMKPNDGDLIRLNKHRYRQNFFYKACTLHLQSLNKTWTTYHDADEYLAINEDAVATKLRPRLNGGIDQVVVDREEVQKLVSHPGIVLKIVQHYRHGNTSSNSSSSRTSLEISTQQSSPATYKPWFDHFQSSHCITFARNLISANESTDEEIRRNVPNFVDPSKFDTLRFRLRATRRRKFGNFGGRIFGYNASTGGVDGPGKNSVTFLSNIASCSLSSIGFALLFAAHLDPH